MSARFQPRCVCVRGGGGGGGGPAPTPAPTHITYGWVRGLPLWRSRRPFMHVSCNPPSRETETMMITSQPPTSSVPDDDDEVQGVTVDWFFEPQGSTKKNGSNTSKRGPAPKKDRNAHLYGGGKGGVGREEMRRQSAERLGLAEDATDEDVIQEMERRRSEFRQSLGNNPTPIRSPIRRRVKVDAEVKTLERRSKQPTAPPRVLAENASDGAEVGGWQSTLGNLRGSLRGADLAADTSKADDDGGARGTNAKPKNRRRQGPQTKKKKTNNKSRRRPSK